MFILSGLWCGGLEGDGGRWGVKHSFVKSGIFNYSNYLPTCFEWVYQSTTNEILIEIA